jgi:hypothetical protein
VTIVLILCLAAAPAVVGAVRAPSHAAIVSDRSASAAQPENNGEQSKLNAKGTVGPTAGNLIVGKPIKLTSAFFLAGSQNKGVLITLADARKITIAMWNAWQTANNDNDTRALAQLGAPGAMLEGTIYNCAMTGLCENANLRPKMGAFDMVVPRAQSYPLYFLAAIRTTDEVSNDGGPEVIEPWMDLEIITKASPSASWRLSFDTGYGANGAQPAFPNFQTTNFSTYPPDAVGAYSPPPTRSWSVPTKDYLSSLASYWQSYKDVGHAPADPKFVKGGDSSGYGEQLAEDLNGSTYNGTRREYQFSVDQAAGEWSFTVVGGFAMVCGTVQDNYTITPLSGVLNQDSDETNYGVPLAPGGYLKITTLAEHESCVYAASDGLAVLGYEEYDANVVGKLAPAVLVDLETTYDELLQSISRDAQLYESCGSKSEKCLKTFAVESAEEFGSFANALSNSVIPTNDESEAQPVEKTMRTLYNDFESIVHNDQTAETLPSIEKLERSFPGQFETLAQALSK